MDLILNLKLFDPRVRYYFSRYLSRLTVYPKPGFHHCYQVLIFLRITPHNVMPAVIVSVLVTYLIFFFEKHISHLNCQLLKTTVGAIIFILEDTIIGNSVYILYSNQC